MVKIATHDSATGEKPYGIISRLVLPFSRTQTKTLTEQFYAGCRFFDIRVRRTKRGWVCAHGLFTTKKRAKELLKQLSDCAFASREPVYVNITYEGFGDDWFCQFIEECHELFDGIIICGVSVKYGKWLKWENLWTRGDTPENIQGFVPLDFRDLRTLLPIPWLWDKLRKDKPEFNEEVYTFVDFL